MTRWRITKAQTPTKSGKIWQVWEGTQRRGVFRTWREAMDYADTKPRTIEIVLNSMGGNVPEYNVENE